MLIIRFYSRLRKFHRGLHHSSGIVHFCLYTVTGKKIYRCCRFFSCKDGVSSFISVSKTCSDILYCCYTVCLPCDYSYCILCWIICLCGHFKTIPAEGKSIVCFCFLNEWCFVNLYGHLLEVFCAIGLVYVCLVSHRQPAGLRSVVRWCHPQIVFYWRKYVISHTSFRQGQRYNLLMSIICSCGLDNIYIGNVLSSCLIIHGYSHIVAIAVFTVTCLIGVWICGVLLLRWDIHSCIMVVLTVRSPMTGFSVFKVPELCTGFMFIGSCFICLCSSKQFPQKPCHSFCEISKVGWFILCDVNFFICGSIVNLRTVIAVFKLFICRCKDSENCPLQSFICSIYRLKYPMP